MAAVQLQCHAHPGKYSPVSRATSDREPLLESTHIDPTSLAITDQDFLPLPPGTVASGFKVSYNKDSLRLPFSIDYRPPSHQTGDPCAPFHSHIMIRVSHNCQSHRAIREPMSTHHMTSLVDEGQPHLQAAIHHADDKVKLLMV